MLLVDSLFRLEPLDDSPQPASGSSSLPWRVASLLTFTVALTCLADYVWWKYNTLPLKTLPTSKCTRQVSIAFRVIVSLLRNNTTDANVLFFQLLQGMVKIHQQQNLGIFYLWTGFRPVVICFSPDIFEAILKSNVNLQKSFDYTFISLWLKEGLVTSCGNKWRQRRRAINTAFHYKILENFIPIFEKNSRIMIEKMKKDLEKSDWIDITPHTTMCTLDTICETAMGISINAQGSKDSVYVNCMHKVSQAFVARIFRPWLWPNIVFFNTRRGKEFLEDTAAMDKFTRNVILERKAEMVEKMKSGEKSEEEGKKKAFLDLLLDMHLSDPKGFSEYDVQEEVDSFMFAGHDTTAVGTAWALYLLGHHPEIQKRVLEEIDSVFGTDLDKPTTEEDLKELRYMDLVIKEAQRIFSPAPYIARQLVEDVEVNGYRIPKGTTCLLVIYMLHQDPKIYPNPGKFDPDRFLPENCAKRHPYAYVPFSAGPRSCIGQKFAWLEEKTMLSNVLRHFRVESVEPRDKLFLAAEMVLRSRGGVKLRMIPRR